jgi:uncharacterized protein (TIRG00374 family)
MLNPKQPKNRSISRLTIIAIGLMIFVGGFIIFLDRKQVGQLAVKANWSYLALALGFIVVSYLLGAIGTVVISRVFGIETKAGYLMKLGFVSNVLSNLIALPASLALRVLLLGNRGANPNQVVGSSLLISYLKNLVFFILIPISLVYIIFSYPLAFGGRAVMGLIIAVLIVAITVATVIIFNSRIRSFVLSILSRVWHFVTHRNIEPALHDFGEAVTRGITELRHKPRFSLLLAVSVIGEVAAMIAALAFCFKALAIPVHLGVLITGFNFGITLTVISLIPGDIGVQEASIAGILAIFGIPFSQGVIGAILFRVVYYFVPFIFSLGFYWNLLKEKQVKPGN